MPFTTIGPFRRGPFRPLNFIAPAGPSLAPQAVAASTAVAVAMQLVVLKSFALTSAVAVALQKQIPKALAATSAAAASVQKQVPKSLAASSAIAASAQKRVNKPVAAASSVAPLLATIKTKIVAMPATTAVAAAIATLKTLFKSSTGGRRRDEPRPVFALASFSAPTLVESKSRSRRAAARTIALAPVLRLGGLSVPDQTSPTFSAAAAEAGLAPRDADFFAGSIEAPFAPQPLLFVGEAETPDAQDDDEELVAALIAAGLM